MTIRGSGAVDADLRREPHQALLSAPPDLAPGTSHFRLTVEEGQALVASLRGRLSGLCQPHYVLDIPGGHGKAYVNAAEHGSDDTA